MRRRFAAQPRALQPIRYAGVMQVVRASLAGWLLAQLLRLAGTPFAPWRGRDVPCAITLRAADDGGIVWERSYAYPRRPPVQVSSEKRCADDGGLLEVVRSRIGMRLAVFEAGGALHFLSVHYLLRVGRRWLRLPAWLTPGTAHVVHTDLGDGFFRFTMTFHHPLLGMLFHQDGVFRGEGDAP